VFTLREESAMRAMLWPVAVVLCATLATSGCRSGGSGWSWNRKSDALLASKNDPPLPSAAASGSVAPAFAATNAGGAAVGGTSAFAAPGSQEGSPYPAATAGYTPPAASPYASHDASQAAPAVAAQQGSYAATYGAAVGATPPSAYPSTGTPDAYQPPAAATAAANPYGAPDPYATPAADPYGAPHPPADAAPAAAYTADNRYANPYVAPPAQPEQTAADHYGAQQAGDPYAAPAASPVAPPETTGPTHYQPGSTSYVPGDTGYNPPGVPKYESPVGKYEVPQQPNVIAKRADPHYRPGGTSDYLGGAHATATADRYNNPAAGYSAPSPYMAPDGSNSPAKGVLQ
jgi:hypothetical protein